MKRTRIFFATTFCLALITATTWAQDPIPGYLNQVSSNNLYVVASDLTTLYGPRHTAYNQPWVGDPCDNIRGAAYPKNNLDMASDYVQALLVSFGYSVTTETVGSAGHNVVATKTGSLYPTKFIEVTAHLDSVASAPGADDNASGVAAVVELARVLQAYSSRYSIRFISFVGEESGLLGSVYHVSQVVSRGEQVKANLNMDGIGWKQYPAYNKNSLWQNGTPESLRIANLFNTVRTAYGINIEWELVSPSGQTSDNASYWNAGFPGVLSIGGLPYSKPGYHGCGDTMPNIDMPNVYKTAQQNLAVLVTLDTEVQPTTWTQTDWSGGSGQDTWSDATRFSSSNGVDVSTSGSLSLSQTSGGEVIFSDSFNRTITPPDPTPFTWSIASGGGAGGDPSKFSINNGILQIANTSGGFAGAYKTGVVITDGSVEADIRFPSGAGGGIAGRVNTGNGARYLIWVDNGNPAVLVLWRMTDWGTSGSILGTAPIASVGTGWHHAKLVFSGSTIQAYWDDMVTPKLTVTDTTPFTSGTCSVDSRYGPSINNYVVKDGAGSTVFSDDFGPDTTSVDPWAPWVIRTGSWTIDSGVLKALNPPQGFEVVHMTTNSSWTDYSVEAQVQLPAGSFGGCVNGRVNPVNGAQYCVALYSDTASQWPRELKLINMPTWQGGSWTEITHVTLPSVGTGWHTIKLDFLGSRIRVYYDGALVIERTDTSYASGGISLHTWIGTSTPSYAGAFDNVVVRSPAQYGSSGTLLSSAFDGGSGVQWQTVSWDAGVGGGSTVRVRTRTAGQASQLAAAAWSDYYTTSGSPITSANERWIQYEVSLSSPDPANTPVLSEMRVNYMPSLSSPPQITLQPQHQIVSAGQPVSFSAAASGQPTPTVQWQVSTDGGLNWNDVPGATAATLSFTAALGDNDKQYHAVFANAAGSATSDPATLTVNNKVTPVITWSDPANIVYGMALSGAQLNATANVPGSFAYSPAAGVVLNAGVSQALNVTFTPNDTANYNSASATAHIDVDKAGQTISFGALAAKTYGDGSFTLGATATSGLAVSYSSSDPTVATVAGNTVTILKAGTTTITASQLGNANYNAAAPVPQTLDSEQSHAGDYLEQSGEYPGGHSAERHAVERDGQCAGNLRV